MTSVVTVATMAVLAVVVALIALFFVLLAVALMFGEVHGLSTGMRPFGFPLLLVVLAGVWLFGRFLMDIARRDVRFGIRWSRATRLHRFAAANGFVYTPEAKDPPMIGMLFTSGTRRLARDVVAGQRWMVSDPADHVAVVPFELGNYQHAGLAHERRVRRFGFLHVSLSRSLPQMVLIARANDRRFRRSTVPWRIPRDQVVPLGDPFDSHFTLYCPADYADDARYLFTPKLMRVLLEHARTFDVEIVHDRMLLSRDVPLDMSAPETYVLLDDLVRSVGATASVRAEMYMDPRSDEPADSAPTSRFLRVGRPRALIVIGWLAGAYCVSRIVALVLGVGI